LNLRTVAIEFESVAAALAAYQSPVYQTARKVLGDEAKTSASLKAWSSWWQTFWKRLSEPQGALSRVKSRNIPQGRKGPEFASRTPA